MRRFSLYGLTLALALLQGAPAGASDRNGTIEAPLGSVTQLRLSGAARHVVVGNPAVADITLDTQHSVSVFGKRPGSTNLAVLDGAGRVILERRIFVPAAGEGSVTVRYGSTKTWTPGGTVTVVDCSTSACAPAATLPTESPYRGGSAAPAR